MKWDEREEEQELRTSMRTNVKSEEHEQGGEQ